MAHDVFISVSSRDKPTGDAACAVLESIGIRCWIAPRDIAPGAEWAEAIIDAIASARCMVLVFSGHANTSSQIRREVERAVNKGIAVIPLRIEDVQPSKTLEYFISTPHWLDAFTPPLERHLYVLAQAVKLIVAQSSRSVSDDASLKREQQPNKAAPLSAIRSPDPIDQSAERSEHSVNIAQSTDGSASFPSVFPDRSTSSVRWTDSTPHPWRRFMARSVDIIASFFVIAILLSLFDEIFGASSFEFFDQVTNNSVVASFLAYFLSIPFSGLSIGLTGGSLGKWLMGVRILGRNKRAIGVSAALMRELAVGYRGIGLGLPIVTLITGIKAYRRLIDTGATSWDSERTLIVLHRPKGYRQKLLAAMCILIFGGCLLAGTLDQIDERSRPENDQWSACAKAFNKEDFSAALPHCQKAADENVPDAQNVLGYMYLFGKGLPQDRAQAFALFKKSADQGFATAQTNLAWMYDSGTGIPKDAGQARIWYERAAANGNETAKKWLNDHPH